MRNSKLYCPLEEKVFPQGKEKEDKTWEMFILIGLGIDSSLMSSKESTSRKYLAFCGF